MVFLPRPDSSIASELLPDDDFDLDEIREADDAAVSVDTLRRSGLVLADDESSIRVWFRSEDDFFIPKKEERRRRRDPVLDAVSVDPFLCNGADSVDPVRRSEADDDSFEPILRKVGAESVDPFRRKGAVDELPCDPILRIGKLWWDVDRSAEANDREDGTCFRVIGTGLPAIT